MTASGGPQEGRTIACHDVQNARRRCMMSSTISILTKHAGGREAARTPAQSEGEDAVCPAIASIAMTDQAGWPNGKGFPLHRTQMPSHMPPISSPRDRMLA